MSVSTAPRRPDVDERLGVDPEALIEEARRRARNRRQRNVVGVLAVLLGGLWLYSLVGPGGTTGPTSVALSPSASAAPPLPALPEELSFNAEGAIWLVHRDGSRDKLVDHLYAPDRIVYTMYGVEWSPDGTQLLAFRQSASPALVLVGGDGNIGPKVTSGASIGRWSADGHRIAFIRGTPGAGDAIFVVSSDGTGVRRVARFARYGSGSFSWSPDGRQIVYAGRRDTGLFVVDADGRRVPRSVARIGATEAQWSPDGSLIAFMSGGHVHVVRPDGTGLRRMVDGYAYGLAWSPDSKSIAFVGPTGPRTFGNISTVRRDGSRLRRVARCACTLFVNYRTSIAWSPDGSRIAYVSGRGNTVSTARPDGSAATRVAAQPDRGHTGNLYPQLPLWRPAHVGP